MEKTYCLKLATGQQSDGQYTAAPISARFGYLAVPDRLNPVDGLVREVET